VESTDKQLPTKRKAPNPDQDQHRPTPKKARIVAGQRVRSPQQKFTRRIQSAQIMSTRREAARGKLESNRTRLAEEAAALAEQRYKLYSAVVSRD
jgi:hypothetical protein